MAKPNYNYEKRQREIAKKKKKEEKRQNKLQDKAAQAGPATNDPDAAPQS